MAGVLEPAGAAMTAVHLWTLGIALALVLGAVSLASLSFGTFGWAAWVTRFIAVSMMIAAVWLLGVPS
jgi:hypothetical protein